MKRYFIDRLKKVLIVKKDSIVDRHIKFDGKIVAGMYSSFWGNVEAEEVYLSKGCYVGGIVKCKRAVIGPYSRFSSVMAEEDVLILDKCLGNLIKAGGNVRIRKGSAIKAVEASYVIVDGTSKIGKLSAKKVIVSSD